jgi:hypothetical protein
MKLTSYTRLGKSGFGAVVDNGIVDLTGRLDTGIDTLRGAIAANLIPVSMDYVKECGPDISWSGLSLLPVIPDPKKFFVSA